MRCATASRSRAELIERSGVRHLGIADDDGVTIVDLDVRVWSWSWSWPWPEPIARPLTDRRARPAGREPHGPGSAAIAPSGTTVWLVCFRQRGARAEKGLKWPIAPEWASQQPQQPHAPR